MTVRENLLAESDVCPPGSTLVVPEGDFGREAGLLKVIADPTRLAILRIVAANGSVCACDLESPLGLSQPTISHHLRQLFDAGVITREKRGTWAFYAIDRDGLQAAGSPITALIQ
ncbi:ArsR/SmtB family transcription factor [Demequina flava]|uniref:ArsR/SmtB family transcription factor n=1 Tax=Demequina flava TaxID=1095025 RepID=UPI0009E3CBDC|nr:metalloregulator ArsR/SmtB family transcription factor [Demequina flava]